jgi:hypothetical protein
MSTEIDLFWGVSENLTTWRSTASFAGHTHWAQASL